MPILDIGRVAPDQPGRRWVTRAEQLLATGEAEAALAVCDEGLQALPDDPGCLVMRARVLHRLQRLEEAMQALWRVVALDPTRPEARRGLEDLLTGTLNSTAVSGPPRHTQGTALVTPMPSDGPALADADGLSPALQWTDEMFGDLEQRLRAREAVVTPSADELAALAELERWLAQLTGVSA